jgi:hypothetical protein
LGDPDIHTYLLAAICRGATDTEAVRLLEGKGVSVSREAVLQFRHKHASAIEETFRDLEKLALDIVVASKHERIKRHADMEEQMRELMESGALVIEEEMPGGRSRRRFNAPLVEQRRGNLMDIATELGHIGTMAKLVHQENLQLNQTNVQVNLTWDDGSDANPAVVEGEVIRDKRRLSPAFLAALKEEAMSQAREELRRRREEDELPYEMYGTNHGKPSVEAMRAPSRSLGGI